MEPMVDKVLKVAENEIGTEANSGCDVKYNTEYYGGRVNSLNLAWCLVFVWWVFQRCGLSDLFGTKTASCSTFVSWHKKWIVPIDDAQPGDIIFFDFSTLKRRTEHVGILAYRKGNDFITIDGNTSDKKQGNGGKVLKRTRHKMYVSKVLRPPYPVIKEKKMLHWIKEVPEWAKESVEKAMRKGIISFTEEGGFNLYEENLQALVWLNRLKLLD